MAVSNTTRRSFVKSSALAGTALALPITQLLGQATQVDAHIDVVPSESIGTISPEIYSHFIEQLGGVTYDGVWVGEGSKIPNVGGRPDCLHRSHARSPGTAAALAGRLFRRLLRLARWYWTPQVATWPCGLLGPAGVQPVRPS